MAFLISFYWELNRTIDECPSWWIQRSYFCIFCIPRKHKVDCVLFDQIIGWESERRKNAKIGTELIFTVHLSSWCWSFLVFLATRDERTRESFLTLIIHPSDLLMSWLSDAFLFPSKQCHFVVCIDKRYEVLLPTLISVSSFSLWYIYSHVNV